MTTMMRSNAETPSIYNAILNGLNHPQVLVQGIGPGEHMAKLAIIKAINTERSPEISGILLSVIAAKNIIKANSPIMLGLIIPNTISILQSPFGDEQFP